MKINENYKFLFKICSIDKLFGLFRLHKIRWQYYDNFWKVWIFMYFLIRNGLYTNVKSIRTFINFIICKFLYASKYTRFTCNTLCIPMLYLHCPKQQKRKSSTSDIIGTIKKCTQIRKCHMNITLNWVWSETLGYR